MDESELVVRVSEDLLSDKLQEAILMFFKWQGFELNSSSSRKGFKTFCFENTEQGGDKRKVE